MRAEKDFNISLHTQSYFFFLLSPYFYIYIRSTISTLFLSPPDFLIHTHIYIYIYAVCGQFFIHIHSPI